MSARCSCPMKFDDVTRAVVRAGRDRFCPVHGEKTQELPHCATCTCGTVPIVQTVEVAKAIAEGAQPGERYD